MKVVLISSIALPDIHIGSWPKMYDYLLAKNQTAIDYVICPQPHKAQHAGVKYSFIKRLPYPRVTKHFVGSKYYYYLKAVMQIIEQEGSVIVKIIDNIGLLNELHDYLAKKKLRQKVRILFFIHGYSYFFENDIGYSFYQKIDLMIYLTYSSYRHEVDKYREISCQCSVLNNGVNSKQFFMVDRSEALTLKKEIGFDGKKICLWVSQERPKKGLHIMLQAWQQSMVNNHPDFVLLIIGTSMTKQEGNIHFLGRIANQDLPKYYQSAEFYFFTTLCHEGFGLSLAEAIKCGCKVFASDIAPMKEVTHHGKFATLVDNPHMTTDWVNVLNNLDSFSKELVKDEADAVYDLEDWCENITKLLLQEKKLFNR